MIAEHTAVSRKPLKKFTLGNAVVSLLPSQSRRTTTQLQESDANAFRGRIRRDRRSLGMQSDSLLAFLVERRVCLPIDEPWGEFEHSP